MRKLTRSRPCFSPEGVFVISSLVAVLVMVLAMGVK